jgi:hypothetical protein
MLRDKTNSIATTSVTTEGTRKGGTNFSAQSFVNDNDIKNDDNFENEQNEPSSSASTGGKNFSKNDFDELAIITRIETEPTIQKFFDEAVDDCVLEFIESFDSIRAESERCLGTSLEHLYHKSTRQMTRDELVLEKSDLKKRLRAFDARLLKVNNIVASKTDKRHARPMYARLARVKQQIELLEIRTGLEELPNLKAAIRGK